MEPVHIDFLIGGNAEQEGDKVVQKMDDITGATKRAKDSFKQSIADQRGVIKQIEADITALEKKLSGAAPGRAKQEVQLDLSAAKKVLEEEKNALIELESKVETTAQKHTRLRTQVMDAKDALAQMEMAGMRGTAEYNAMAQRLGQLNDQMGDTAMQARILADDEKGFKGIASGVSGLAGAMSAAVGAASLFGAEQEDLAKIQTRLQSVMAVTIGLQQVAETLNKDSYFSVVLLTRAKQAWAAANLQLAGTMGVSTTAARAFMLTGIGALIGFVGLLVAALAKWQKQQEEVTRIQREFRDVEKEVAKSMSDEKTKAEELLRVARDHSKTVQMRKEAVERLNKLMPDFNGHINKEGELTGNADVALKNYLVTLYKVEKAKKLIADIGKNNEKMDSLTANGPEELDGWQKANVAFTGFFSKKWGKHQRNYEEGVNLKQWNKDLSSEIASKTANEKALSDLLADKTIFEGVFGKSEKEKQVKSATTEPAKEAYDAEKSLQEKLISLREQTTKLQIDLMKDGLEKRLAEIDAEKQQELDKITKAQQDIVDAYNKNHHGEKGFKKAEKIEDVKGINPETIQAWNDETAKISSNAEAKRVKAADDANKEIIQLANSYGDERKQIAERYGQDIEKLEKAGQTGAVARAKKERDKRISDTTAEMIMSTELYKTATDEKLQISAEATEKLIEMIRQRIEAELAAGNLSKEKAKELLDQLNKTGVSRQQNANQNNPFKQLLAGLNQYKKAKQDIEKARAGGATPEEFAKLEGAANSSLKSTAAAAGASLDATNQIIGSVVGAMDELGMLTDEQKKDAQDVMSMVGGAAGIAKGIATGNPVDIISGSVKLLSGALSFFDFKSKKIAKQQKAVKADLDGLTRAYSRLQHEVSRALGTDVFGKQRESIANLKRQVQDYYKLIELEQRKRRKKQDQNAIAEWKQAIETAKQNMETIVSDIRKELVGGAETKGMASDVANALVSAFQQGEDAAQAFGKVFDDVIRNAVLNAFKLRYLEKPIDEWLNKLGGYMEDGQLSDIEKKALADYKTQIYETAKTQFDAISGFFEPTDAKGKGIQGEVKNISEETGLKLTGAINAMRLNVDEVVKGNRSGIDIMSRQLAALEEIKQNTAFCKKLERVDETLYDLKVNGIKLK